MTAPIDLEALRAALAVIQRETVRAGGVSFSDGRDLIAAHAAVSAALAELTTRRARDAEVEALVAAAIELRILHRVVLDVNCKCDEGFIASQLSKIDAALRPFHPSDAEGDNIHV